MIITNEKWMLHQHLENESVDKKRLETYSQQLQSEIQSLNTKLSKYPDVGTLSLPVQLSVPPILPLYHDLLSANRTSGRTETLRVNVFEFTGPAGTVLTELQRANCVGGDVANNAFATRNGEVEILRGKLTKERTKMEALKNSELLLASRCTVLKSESADLKMAVDRSDLV